MYTSETVKRKNKCLDSIHRIGGIHAIIVDNAPDLRKSAKKSEVTTNSAKKPGSKKKK